MEPRIQYARTKDGVNIAYGVFGEGLPLIYTPSAHGIGVHYYTYLSYSRRSVDQLTAAGFQVVRYDGRGTGSSDRMPTEFSLETDVLDLAAVADRLGFERFTLVGHFAGAQAAIAYATRRPERVSHLVLRDPWASGSEMYQMFPGNRVLFAMRPFAEQQWDLVSITIAAVGFGLADSDISKEYASAIRSGITPATWVAHSEASDEIDITDLLENLSVPTLVVLDTALPGRPPNAIGEWGAPVKKIVAAIPDARLVTTGDLGVAVSEFVRAGSQAPAAAARSPGGLQTILFTDVEGSTAFTDRMGDAAAREVLRKHERITREALKTHGGSEVKTMGDGFMASFGSATRALECAVAVQRAFADGDIRVRIGLNAGEPIAEDDPGGRGDLFGTAVIVAARIAAQAHGGEILVSDVVRQLVAGKGFLFSDRGDHALKGFEDPVRVWEVRWREE
ncbi:MAG: adenylate/guanylate cyclase domain-containing protein [Chloroflexi bacterium]|nr:MAG: adenylate/guanylate cyclase domain-containing protein [Chloroflexota bacterium]